MKRPTPNPLLAVQYGRASTDEQALGPPAQLAACERWASANGVRIVATFVDQGVSGAAALDQRPGLLAALDALKAHGAGTLLVSRRDRIARDVVLAAMVERLAERHGARVMMADGAGNGTGPEAALMRSLLDAFSAYERALIRSRTKSALAVKKSRGERLGGAIPYGYRLNEDGVHLDYDYDEQVLVSRARALRAEGKSLRAIGAALLAEGFRPRCGKVWHASVVAGILAAEKFSVPCGTRL